MQVCNPRLSSEAITFANVCLRHAHDFGYQALPPFSEKIGETGDEATPPHCSALGLELEPSAMREQNFREQKFRIAHVRVVWTNPTYMSSSMHS